MYIDKELVDMEHLCCLAHEPAKLVYVHEQSGDVDAKYLIDCFGELYGLLLSTCRMNGLSALKYLNKFFREVVNGQGL